MLPNNSARKKKLPLALPFFKVQTSVFIVDGVICYGLEDFLDESKVWFFFKEENKGQWKKKWEPQKKKDSKIRRPAEQREEEANRRRDPSSGCWHCDWRDYGITYDSTVAVVLGIYSTCNAGNFTRLHLVKLLPALLVQLICNTTANHAIIYTYVTPYNSRYTTHA